MHRLLFAILLAQHEDGAAEALDQAAGDDAYHAAMPIGCCKNQRGLVLGADPGQDGGQPVGPDGAAPGQRVPALVGQPDLDHPAVVRIGDSGSRAAWHDRFSSVSLNQGGSGRPGGRHG